MNIYVSHLSWGTSSEGLGNLFMQFGEVASANVITDRETGRSRGFGFVEMPNEEEGQKAIDQLNGTSFEGQTITVNVARPREERSSGGYGGNRGGGYGGNRGGGYGGNGGGYGRNRYKFRILFQNGSPGERFSPYHTERGGFYRPVFCFSLFSTRPATSGKRAKNYPRDLCFSRKKR